MSHESVSAAGGAGPGGPPSAAAASGRDGDAPAERGALAHAVSERIRQRLGVLSVSERRVARVLLSGPPTAGLESSAKLAEHAGVSGPTISRFVTQQLGYENYAAFQQALREEISTRVLSPVEVYRRQMVEPASAGFTGRSGAILGELVSSSIQGLDPAEFARATSLLGEVQHHVLAIGGSFSQLVAGYLVGVLRELRPGVRLVPPAPAERAAALADIGKKDVLSVFDFRRYERDTQDFAQAAKAAGARIVLFTDPWLSPITDIADALLPAQVAGPSPLPSLAATVAVVETLLTAIAGELGESGRVHFQRFDDIANRWIPRWPGPDDTAGADSGPAGPAPAKRRRRLPGPPAGGHAPAGGRPCGRPRRAVL
jgi:DNA-binding MurR/RpiR family transcriptional regulator